MQNFGDVGSANIFIGFPLVVLGALLGPSFTRISGPCLAGRTDFEFLVNEARETTDRPDQAARATVGRRNVSNSSDGELLAAWIVGGCVVVALYLRFRTPILWGVAATALGVFVTSLLAIVFLSLRRVVTGRWSKYYLMGALFFGAGITDVVLLWHPVVGGASNSQDLWMKIF